MTKRIAIATIGTQGDVQPYIALAVALKTRGFDVILGGPKDFEDLITGYGFEFYSLGTNIQSFVSQSRFDNAMSQNMLINAPALLREGQKIVETAARHLWDMAQNADALVLNMNTSFGIDIAEALDLPAVMAALQPLNTTSEFPICAYYGPDLGPAFNKLSYTAVSVQQLYYDLPRNKLRRELMGLQPLRRGGMFQNDRGEHLTTLYAYSDVVSPRPRDWPSSAIVTGYWQLRDNSDWAPSERFQRFLEDGDAPVYIGFGSMPFGTERNTEILKNAVKQWGGRAVVARGWGGINPDDLPDNIYAIKKAPHDQLFKYVSGVVHHGGAGTTAAGLHAGKPAFVVPQAIDQPYWARRVHELGCGPAPVRLRKLTADTLAENLKELTSNSDYTRCAELISKKLLAEDGPDRAVDEISRVITGYQPGRTSKKPSHKTFFGIPIDERNAR